jgi:serine phosphatase RsbU (regulator of sigma subunit)
MPCLVLTEDHERWSAWQHPAMILQSWTQDPGVLSGMLFALIERQKFVDSLSRELALAMRCHAGVRSEIERMHEELHLAAGIQHEFTAAAMPKVPGLEFGVIYRPVNMVSGDIYNVREIEPGVVSFFVADAVGHGVPAALLTMVLTNSLISSEENHRGTTSRRCSPAQVLAKLNHRLVEGSAASGRFATAVYGHLHAATGEVVLASAGHPLPLIVNAHGTREIDAQGPLLGVFPDASFEEVRFTLAPGETLSVFSDGLEAAFGSGGGKAKQAPTRHLEALSSALRMPSHAAADPLGELDLAIDEQTGSLHQLDDVTVLALRRLAASAKAAA